MTERYKRKPNAHCKICNKRIYRRPSQIELTGGNVFCSNTCYGKSCRDERPCVICGKMILSSLHKKTCSRACSNKNRVGITYGIKRPNDKVRAQEIIKKRLIEIRGMKCEVCGYQRYEILHIHHIDKNRSNNDFDNLELVCPNCHYEKHFIERNLENKTKI
jgi:hypothetical protein